MALPALLAAFRVAASLGGRAAVAARSSKGLKSLANVKSLEGMLKAVMKMPIRAPAAAAGPQPLAAGALPATRQQWMGAAKQFATPNPNASQVADFVQSQQPRQEDSGELGRTTGDLVKNLIGLGGAIGLAKVFLRDWTSGIEESAQRLRDFNPLLGEAAAKMEIANLRRDYREASATGQSTSALMEARSNRLDAAQPFSNATTNLGNTLKTAITDLQTKILGWLDAIGVDEAINYITDSIRWFRGKPSLEDEAKQFQSQFKDFLRGLGQQPESPAPNLGGPGGQGGF